jgi:Flp pilus assembly protein TadG
MRLRVRSDSGNALVELALVAPFLMLLVVGVVGVGRVFQTAMVLSNAARVGAQYGAQDRAKSLDAAGIQTAAQQEATSLSGLGVSSSRVCECPGGVVVACTTTTCTGYGAPMLFLQVTATTTFNSRVAIAPIPGSVALSRTARLRVQ